MPETAIEYSLADIVSEDHKFDNIELNEN